MHPTTQGFVLTLLAVMAWGAQLPIAAGAMPHIDSTGINLVRYGLSSLLLMSWLLRSQGAQRIRQGLGEPIIWWAGVVGMAGSSSLVFLGMRFTRPEIAVLVIALQPTMTVIAEWLLYRKRPPGVTVVCMVIAFSGLAWAVTRGGHLLTQGGGQAGLELLGCGLVLLGAAAWVFYTLICARLEGWNVVDLTALTCLTALPLLVVVWLLSLVTGFAVLPQPSAWWEVVWRVGFLALFGVLGAMLCWNTGTARLGTLNAILMLNFMPVFFNNLWQRHIDSNPSGQT